ncbi:hypothetical protein K470DRAFT_262819 [Piedraia hortae CBS 480.64]|uniref:Myb-like domain-containing protein n=1 Tax=Piedraia hortae CBS 480.64 TaxID=1314780 RepID=A0A6A7C4T9_9PEZI|nr:hypothetical protein K470DRAFT_262819 [Piedraia hortae CBS 480.64]
MFVPTPTNDLFRNEYHNLVMGEEQRGNIPPLGMTDEEVNLWANFPLDDWTVGLEDWTQGTENASSVGTMFPPESTTNALEWLDPLSDPNLELPKEIPYHLKEALPQSGIGTEHTSPSFISHSPPPPSQIQATGLLPILRKRSTCLGEEPPSTPKRQRSVSSCSGMMRRAVHAPAQQQILSPQITNPYTMPQQQQQQQQQQTPQIRIQFENPPQQNTATRTTRSVSTPVPVYNQIAQIPTRSILPQTPDPPSSRSTPAPRSDSTSPSPAATNLGITRPSGSGIATLPNGSASGVSLEDWLLLNLKGQGLKWKDITAEFNRATGQNVQIAALQMRFKRLREKGRVWAERDVENLSRAVNEWEGRKWSWIAEKMAELGSAENWTPMECERMYRELGRGNGEAFE